MTAKRGWLLVVWSLGCGGGGGSPSGDPGVGADPGVAPDVALDRGGECQTKEDCPTLPCRLAVCLAGACDYQVVPEGAVCSDPAACIPSGVCDAQGRCQGEWACDDHDDCTTDRCEAGQCLHSPVESGPCDDGDPCSDGDRCVLGECKPGTPVCDCKEDGDCPAPTDLCLGRLVCDPLTRKCVPDPAAKVQCPTEDDAPCRKNQCDPKNGQCRMVVSSDGAECDLGKCLVNETCQNGECVGTKKCASNDPCKVGTCDEVTGDCAFENAEDKTPCDDHNPCTQDDHCEAGVCTATLPEEVCNGQDDDCDGYTDPENAKGCKTYYYDYDKDGAGDGAKSKCLCGPLGFYTAAAGDDCNDQDPVVRPGATESCNGQDDDCDGVTDEEDSQGCTRYYKDLDQDQYGVADDSMCLCAPKAPHTAAQAGDCNDSDGLVHPGAVEVCNLMDDDCNGQTDEGEGKAGCTIYWLDKDGDGYGASSSKCLCVAQAPYTSNNNKDCNDNDKNIYPGATEVCNGSDDDCDGETDEGENLSGCKNHYEDQDQDGYGAGTPKCLCGPQGGYVTTQAGDCAPTDPAIHPGGKVCGKDGDCDSKLLDVDEPCDDGNTTQWDGCDQCAIKEFQVNTYYVDDQKYPDVAFPGTAGNQGYFIVWEGVGCTNYMFVPPSSLQCIETADGVWVARFDANGKVQNVKLANTYTEGYQGNAAVAASYNKGAVVVWEGKGSATELDEIYCRRLNPDGTFMDSAVTRVNKSVDGSQGQPDVVVDSNLNFRVVWKTVAGSLYGIWLRAFTSSLTAWDEVIVSGSANGTALGNPRIAAFSGGARFVVVWDQAISPSDKDIYARRYQWNTTALDSSAFRVNDYATGIQGSPAVAGNPSSGGGFVVVWAGLGSSGSGGDIWARAYNSDGTPVGGAVLVNQTTTGDQILPDVAMAADGSFVVVWSNAGSDRDVFFRRFKADQTPLTNEVKVNHYLYGMQDVPAISSASDGIVIVAWHSQNQDGSGFGIFAQRFGPNGERLFR